jgi:hypothetical protein
MCSMTNCTIHIGDRMISVPSGVYCWEHGSPKEQELVDDCQRARAWLRIAVTRADWKPEDEIASLAAEFSAVRASVRAEVLAEAVRFLRDKTEQQHAEEISTREWPDYPLSSGMDQACDVLEELSQLGGPPLHRFTPNDDGSRPRGTILGKCIVCGADGVSDRDVCNGSKSDG